MVKKIKGMFSIPGSGNITSREARVSSFLKLHIGIHGQVELVQSNDEKVIIECDDNLQENINVQNSGQTLYIYERAACGVHCSPT